MICLLLMLKTSGDNKKERHKGSGKFDHDDGSDRDDGLLEGCESDNANFGPMQSSDDEHPFSTMSRVFRENDF